MWGKGRAHPAAGPNPERVQVSAVVCWNPGDRELFMTPEVAYLAGMIVGMLAVLSIGLRMLTR
jgi:hypothetical protein